MDSATVIKHIFKQRKYSLSFVVSFFGMLIFAIWMPNLGFILKYIFSFDSSILDKMQFMLSSFQAFGTNFSVLSQITTIIISLLFGLNIVFIYYFLSNKKKMNKCGISTGGGFFSGILGIGCASCGSVVLSSIFGTGISFGILSKMPLSGQEFAFISIIILFLSWVNLINKSKKYEK